ncbi:hypothetical protein PENANT_c024G00762 [Penicillium antarcticum]|uniref:Coenzyme Q-binding protein COQ10 START domain-containing protein n=1 Tax=Penicillium antarcticum TaxID=416450 RepID=A0A1V6PXY0_9EURO|nr:hypothetical protein PENANT_c024G00762 [Penicillium antarcticum]
MTNPHGPTLEDPSNATRATPTITPEAAVLHIGSSTFINAPAAKVWESLTDTSTWPAWNSFVPRVTIRSQPSNATNETTDLSPILQKDTRFIFHVRMDPTSTSKKPQAATDVYGRVTECSAPNAETGEIGRIVWGVDPDAPGAHSLSMLKAERVHEVKAVEGGTELWVDDLCRFVQLPAAGGDVSGRENIAVDETGDRMPGDVASA